MSVSNNNLNSPPGTPIKSNNNNNNNNNKEVNLTKDLQLYRSDIEKIKARGFKIAFYGTSKKGIRSYVTSPDQLAYEFKLNESNRKTILDLSKPENRQELTERMKSITEDHIKNINILIKKYNESIEKYNKSKNKNKNKSKNKNKNEIKSILKNNIKIIMNKTYSKKNNTNSNYTRKSDEVNDDIIFAFILKTLFPDNIGIFIPKNNFHHNEVIIWNENVNEQLHDTAISYKPSPSQRIIRVIKKKKTRRNIKGNRREKGNGNGKKSKRQRQKYEKAPSLSF